MLPSIKTSGLLNTNSSSGILSLANGVKDKANVNSKGHSVYKWQLSKYSSAGKYTH